MKEDPFLSESSMLREPESLLGQILTPALMLTLVVISDLFLVPSVTITPLACTIMISWMALRYRPKLIAFWAVIFVISSCAVLFHDSSLVRTIQNPQWTAVLRTVSACVTAAMAIAISKYRVQLTRGYQQVIMVLEKIPVPIIISDESGTINFVNLQAADLLGVSCEDAPGHSYFSFLANQAEKGKSIEGYLRIFDSDDYQGLKLRIHLRRHPSKLMSGILMGLGRGNERRLVTIITEGPEIQKHSTMPFLR